MRARDGCVCRSTGKHRPAGYSSNAAEPILHLLPLPALADNYIWLLHDDDGNAVVVDTNHPLAGKSLVFDINVLKVESPSSVPLQ